MAERTLKWANVEKAVKAYLGGLINVAVWTETGSDPGGEYITVERVGGNTEWISKHIDVEVTVTAATRARMWELAGDVESAMWSLAAHGGGGVYFDDVTEAFGFAFDPPDNQDVRRAIATYTLTVRPL